MKHKFVFATNNAHKLEEVTAILGNRIELLSLKDIHCHTDIPETADTLEGNALLKAQYIYENYQMDCFADDTGLEVEALNGEPGVYSARYAGDGHNAEANMLKLLHAMEGIENRKGTIPHCIRTDYRRKRAFVRRCNQRRNHQNQKRKLRFWI